MKSRIESVLGRPDLQLLQCDLFRVRIEVQHDDKLQVISKTLRASSRRPLVASQRRLPKSKKRKGRAGARAIPRCQRHLRINGMQLIYQPKSLNLASVVLHQAVYHLRPWADSSVSSKSFVLPRRSYEKRQRGD
jgi:hypothetical protein